MDGLVALAGGLRGRGRRDGADDRRRRRHDAAEMLERMRGAAYLVLPSLSYEALPRPLIEAYANALPVIASRLGTLRRGLLKVRWNAHVRRRPAVPGASVCPNAPPPA